MLTSAHNPTDIRIFHKEAKSLQRNGYDVTVIAPAIESIKKDTIIDKIKILVIPRYKSKLLRPLALFHLFIRGFKTNSDIYHCHEPDALLSGILLKLLKRKKLIYDVHEHWPVAFSENFPSFFRPIIRFTIEKIEKYGSRATDHIIVVIEEQKERFVKLGISSKKIAVIMNTEELDVFDTAEIKYLGYEDNFVISYVGGFEPHRGLDTAIKAMPKILEKIPNAKLLLVGGKGSGKYENELKKLCKELEVEEHVIFTGWIDFGYVPAYIASSDVCLVPHNVNEHINTTIPHKIFQYMTMRKPVIVTDARPLKRIVEETNCGIVIPSGNYEKMADAVIRLYQNKKYAKKLGGNGRRAVEDKYNWGEMKKRLLDIYKNS